jgi:flagellar basal body-associated protein FliL
MGAMNEVQKEEMRQRMFIVRNRLLQDCSDEDHFKIHTAFGTNTFKFFVRIANNPDTNKILGTQQIM